MGDRTRIMCGHKESKRPELVESEVSKPDGLAWSGLIYIEGMSGVASIMGYFWVIHKRLCRNAIVL